MDDDGSGIGRPRHAARNAGFTLRRERRAPAFGKWTKARIIRHSAQRFRQLPSDRRQACRAALARQSGAIHRIGNGSHLRTPKIKMAFKTAGRGIKKTERFFIFFIRYRLIPADSAFF
ncbi:hypothetical protein [Burkholderia plantarii]|uniref:hypothetical protein n=1 Tax=Burkholderia plantarii TaxID=41899 RepID=UPI00114CC376|nr:hypothetical protein [Burkholderia plantarii]